VAGGMAEAGVVGEAARVLSTSIALVQNAGSVTDDARTTVQYIFPVEIEVRAAPDATDPDELTQRALLALVRGLQGLHGLGNA
jgi:hypothetical protein